MAKDADKDVVELVEPLTTKEKVEVETTTDKYEAMYFSERKKSRVLLASSGVFLFLLMVAVGFGLQRNDHPRPGMHSMHMREFSERPGPSGPAFRQ